MGNKVPKMKLTYFNIQGAAEKVRLALVVQGIEFEDERITFEQWTELKPKSKFGQLPLLEIDGKETIAQSMAMLRFVARLQSKTLYPKDSIAQLRVDEVLGVIDDFSKMWMPAFYMGMRPHMFGHAEGFGKTDEGKALIEKLRTDFLKDQLPQFMKYFEGFLGDNQFLVGKELTIADLSLLPTLHNFTTGNIDYVPVDSLEAYPKIVEWMKRVKALPKIAAWYAPKAPKEEAKATTGGILGVGNPLLDISANTPADVLEKYGVKAGDIILAEEKHMPVYEELISQYGPVDYIAGGATQNSIRVAAWMSKGATPCAYAGCVGSDDNAKTLKDCCEKAGVTAEYMVDEATPTGKCACLITPDGERCLITDLQAANNYKKDHLESAKMQELISSSSILYSAGFFLTSGGPDCTKLLGSACEGDKKFCLNLSAPFICEFFTQALDDTLPFVDVLFGNETEAAALGKAKSFGEDVSAIALAIAALPTAEGKGPRMVVITQGASPTIVAFDGKVTEYPVEELSRELLVDTNGAGDAFVGGFLSRLAVGKDTAACCAAGNFAARHIIQRSGCTMAETCDFNDA
jgi:adenosine kinase